MYIELLADTQEGIDQGKPMLVFFCVPHDTEAIRANIRFLVGQLGKTRHYISPNPNARFKYTAERLDGLEVNFMCQELLERLVKSVEEIEYTNKAHLAQLRGDKSVKYYIDKPTAPTTEVPNPQITVASDSVFQVSSLLENSNITEILTTALLDDGTIGLPDLNPFNLESKLDKIRTDIGDAKSHFVGDFHSLMQWFAGSFRGGLFSDINPFGKETMFDRFTRTFNLPFIGGGITTTFWELHHKAFMQSDTVGHSNSWFAKLGDISSISGWLTADDGRLKMFFENVTQIRDYLDYHLGEVQYGLKHFFNIFATPTQFSENDPTVKGHKVYKAWPKPNTEEYTYGLQGSVFQNTLDYLGRGFTLYDWLTMWIKPHGDSPTGLGYVNLATNIKGHELVPIGGDSEKLDTLIDRFSLAFLTTSNTTSWLGKIYDVLNVGLLFGPGLSMLSVINTTLDVIYGVLKVDLGWIARSVEEIAAKDCCGGANTNGSTTVTNPDGSQTTAPNPPTYPPIDPNDPDSPTSEPYPKSRPDTSGNNRDGACGFIWFYMNLLADWLEWLFNLLDPLFYLFKAIGWVSYFENIYNYFFPPPAYGGDILAGGVYLAKVPSSKLRGLVTGFYNFLGKYAGNANIIDTLLTVIPATIRAYADDAACGANGQPEPTAINGDDLIANLIEYLEQQIPTIDDLAWSLVGQGAYIVLDYFLSDTVLADYAQYCPCPSVTANWSGVWYTNQGSPQPWTLTQTGNSVTGHNANNSIVVSGTANGLDLSGSYDGVGAADGTFTWTAATSDYLTFSGNALTSGGTPFGWSGGRNS